MPLSHIADKNDFYLKVLQVHTSYKRDSMNVHLRLERLIFEELLLQAAIESEFARLLAGRKVTADSRVVARVGAALKPLVPSETVTTGSRAI